MLLKYSKVARVRGFFQLKIQVVNITSKGNEDESWIYLQTSSKMLKWGLQTEASLIINDFFPEES